LPLLVILLLGNKSDSCIKIQLEIQGVEMTMELDIGASVSIISDRVYKEKFLNVVLEKSDTSSQLKPITRVKNVIYLCLW